MPDKNRGFMPIQSFVCEETKKLFKTGSTATFSSIERVATRKLTMLDGAFDLCDLKTPPGNKLHPLERERAGQHAIRINDQYRICFRWTPAGPADVEITDYH